jgi:hypothetical protein
MVTNMQGWLLAQQEWAPAFVDGDPLSKDVEPMYMFRLM